VAGNPRRWHAKVTFIVDLLEADSIEDAEIYINYLIHSVTGGELDYDPLIITEIKELP
jgi:hypothetical protein